MKPVPVFGRAWTLICGGMAVATALACLPALASQETTSDTAFRDDPQAHALYDKMFDTMKKAKSLSYESRYHWESKGQTLGECAYTIWLKKPNYFRMEASSVSSGKGGILVGDDKTLYLYWPTGRPRFYPADDDETYRQTSSSVYMTKPAPPGGHSIGHEAGLLGAGMCMNIIDPSSFHGYTDSLQKHLDGVKSLGREEVDGESCDVIEASIMKGQRVWRLWVSRKDHLPRKLKETTHVSHDIITNEAWSKVILDADIPNDKFAWTPPAGWKQWRVPEPEERLLKPGETAPDFALLSAEGKTIRLSEFRDKIVWLYVWRAG